jgi:very-short-patch-repair endonuclease
MVRTLVDLCSRLPLTEAVVITDAALHARRVTVGELAAIKKLERVAGLAEPKAESPMESRLRMILVLGGLARPRAQVSIHDGEGRFVGRPDLYYEKPRLGIEYDGAVHRTTLVGDDRRQNNLLRAGVRLLRFTSVDVLQNPASVVLQVRAALASTYSS